MGILTHSVNPRKYWSFLKTRLKSIEVRKELTDEWDSSGVKKGMEYAILTNEITQAWSGLSVKNYKVFKGLKKENLRDNMSNLELILNMLAEATTTTTTVGLPIATGTIRTTGTTTTAFVWFFRKSLFRLFCLKGFK